MGQKHKSRASIKAVALWSGGKDSCLALHRALDQGIKIECLATFVPADGRDFLAHPRHLMSKQAQAMGLPHLCLPVAEPYRESYVERLEQLHEEIGADAVITGDIDLVGGQPNWIAECCLASDLQVIRPLWKNARNELMDELLERNIQARITWINHPGIPSTWRGQIIDNSLLNELMTLAEAINIDLCGENGEYHTMVVSAPAFGDRTIEE